MDGLFMTNDKTQADSVTDLYISGEFWNEIPDFLASQAPNKVRHLMDFIDFDVILHKLPNKTVSIADIACGAGKVSTGIAKQLRERYPEYQTKVYGYDLSPQAIETAKKLNTEGEFFCRDFNDAGMSFDLALLIMSQILMSSCNQQQSARGSLQSVLQWMTTWQINCPRREGRQLTPVGILVYLMSGGPWTYQKNMVS